MPELPDTHPLVLYSRDQIGRHVAMERMRFRDYATLLVALGEANLPMPMPSEEQIEVEVETFRKLMRSTWCYKPGATRRHLPPICHKSLKRYRKIDMPLKF
ncbi:MAG: hypothetical protein O9256_00315 [Rhizobiaceae bacterium]|nr:hypothetical protein [Rhizobiaceae bacterium]